ncbi:MAG TPA: kelch repeat-containing protein, partial [Thermoplasmata archaeon]|nr:kelch repeat-containing protein [Thermoplasmata archaeon]
ASFTNDSADGYLLLFGGLNASGGVLGDTWTFSAGTWSKLTPSTSPSNRSSAGLTFDAADGYVLLFGGTGVVGGLNASISHVYEMYNDTWNFSAGTWTNISGTVSPQQPQPDGLAYDAADRYVVYTQICRNYSSPYGGPSEMIWGFASGSWTRLNGSCSYGSGGPNQRLGEATTYDVHDGYFLLFGGGGSWYLANADLHDTWTWFSGTWTNRSAPSPIAGLPEFFPSVAYDPAENATVLFGGAETSLDAPINQTWELVGSQWTELSPSTAPAPRWGAAFAYDAADGYAVLFGGTNGTTPLGDTWEFLGGAWTELTPSASPSARAESDLVYDAADGYLVLFGGGGYPDTWTFQAGVWTNITATAGAPSTCGYLPNSLAYDATDGYVLAFGTYAGACSTLTNQTWKFSAGSWTNLTSGLPTAPVGRQEAAVAGMGPAGGVVLFGGDCWSCSGTGFPTDTWQFRSGSWTSVPGGVGPTGRVNPSFVYVGSLSEGLLFGGFTGYSNTGSGFQDDAWYWVEDGGPNPLVEAFRDTPAVVDLGNATTFASTVLGGTAPLTYSYGGLPPGCASVNASSLTCTPTTGASGTYVVTLEVKDALGNISLGTAGLTVHADPTVANFTATPANVSVGSRTILRAAVAGGTAPFGYVYAGLPTGCLSQTVPAVPCEPSSTGTFHVTVTITDSDARSANATVVVTVGGLVAGHLTLTAFVANPAQFVLGNATYLNVTANTTAGPLTFAYSGLPAGCTSANQSSLVCLPTTVGTYTVRANVSDTTGDMTTVAANVTVYAPGSPWLVHVVRFGITPDSVVLGGSVVLYVVATGGNGTLDYSYQDLPSGCASQDTVAFVCHPTVAGSFNVTFEVTDQSGDSAVVRAELTVAPAPSHPPGGTTKAGASGAGGLLPEWLEVALVATAGLALAALLAVFLRGRSPPRPRAPRRPPASRSAPDGVRPT